VGTRGVTDDHLGHQTLDEGVAHAAIDRSNEIQPVRRQAGSQVRHVDHASTAKTARARIRRDHLAIRRDVGAADLVYAGLDVGRADEVADHVSERDRLDRGANPTGTHHDGQTLGEVAQHLERDASRAEYDRRSQLDDRNVFTRERGADFLAAHEMLRLGVVSESTEIHDAFDARRGGRSSATFCQLTVAISEVAGTQRVHEVVGDLASGQGIAKRRFVANIDRAGFSARDVRRMARDRDDVVSLRGERDRKRPSDETARSDHCDAHALTVYHVATPSGPLLIPTGGHFSRAAKPPNVNRNVVASRREAVAFRRHGHRMDLAGPDTRSFTFAKPAGSLMDRSQAFGEQLDSLLSISAEIASVRELADVQDRALAYCLELTRSEFGFIGLLDESGENLLVAAIKGFEPTTPGFVGRNRFMSVRPSVFGIVLLEDRPYISNDVANDPLSVGQPAGHPPVRAFIGVPLRVGATLIGVLGAANKHGGYDRYDERLLSTFANQVAVAIDNARLYEQQRQMITGLVSVVDLATSGPRSGRSRGRSDFAPSDPERKPTGSGSADSGSLLGALTDGQREILALVSEGCSNREIANRVQLSENTVKTHLQEIFRKLGVRNRVEAAIRAVRDGLL
jgi:DNA-binding CsgD family transcriptional regulator